MFFSHFLWPMLPVYSHPNLVTYLTTNWTADQRDLWPIWPFIIWWPVWPVRPTDHGTTDHVSYDPLNPSEFGDSFDRCDQLTHWTSGPFDPSECGDLYYSKSIVNTLAALQLNRSYIHTQAAMQDSTTSTGTQARYNNWV